MQTKLSLYKLLLAFSVCASVTISGCATAPKTGESAQDQSKPGTAQERQELETVERLYRQHNYEGALKRSKVFISHHPKSAVLDQVHNLRGLAYLGLKQYQYALINFKHAIDLTQSDSLKNMALYNQAFVEFELNQIDDARSSLEGIKGTSLAANDRSKYFILAAKIDKARKDFTASARDILQAAKSTSLSQVSGTEPSPLSLFLADVLENINNPSTIDQLASDFEDSALLDHIYYRGAVLASSAGDKNRAQAFREKILSQFSQGRYASFARENITTHSNIDTSEVNTKRIGIILTLSGKFGRFGYKALQGAQLAGKIFGPKVESGGNDAVTLVVIDDHGEPEQALKAVDELVQKHHVAGIIGPLVSRLADPVAKRSEELGIPLITLTQKEVVGSSYVFNAALTPAMQVRELMRYATDIAGVSTFAILSPNSKFGDEYSKAFWDEVDAKEKKVTGFETYPDTETDFRAYIDNLVGLSNTEARSHELEEIKILKQNSPVKFSNKKMNKMFTIRPIIDFQAVFIPDEPKSLGQILPTFAYRDVDKTLFLGINTWNSPELLARAGNYANGAVFVDAFFPGTTKTDGRKFIEEFKETFKSEPSSLEAVSYDATKIMASLLAEGISSRSELRDKIANLKNFPGVMGNISYTGGKLTKQLAILTVKGGKIEEIAPQ